MGDLWLEQTRGQISKITSGQRKRITVPSWVFVRYRNSPSHGIFSFSFSPITWDSMTAFISLGIPFILCYLNFPFFEFHVCKGLKKRYLHQAVTKDLTSSSKFSGSCVLTLQTLQIKEKERRSVCVNTCQDPLRTSFLSSLWSLRCHLLIAEAIDDIMIKGKERLDEESKHEVINFYSFSLYKSFLLIICKWLKRLRENELDFFHNLLFLSSCWHSLSFSFMCQQDNERK